MKIRHHLAKGFNEIPLKNIAYATEHQKKGDAVAHVGWKIQGEYGGENERAKKHRYEVIFTPEEAIDFRDKLDKMLERFTATNLTFEESDAPEVEEE